MMPIFSRLATLIKTKAKPLAQLFWPLFEAPSIMSSRALRPLSSSASMMVQAEPPLKSSRLRGQLIGRLKKAKTTSEVEELSSRLGPIRDVKSLTVTMSSLRRVDQSLKALRLFSKAQRRGVEPDVISYSVAISACERSRRWRRGLHLLKEMSERGLEPDVICYSAAISACEKGKQWEQSLELIEEMRAKGLEPDLISYNAAISACEKGDQWQSSLDLLEEMRRNGVIPDRISYNATISACKKGGEWRRAVDLFEEMQHRGIEPNVITYSAVIAACELAGKHEKAMVLFRQAKGREVFVETDLVPEEDLLDLRFLSVPVARTALRVYVSDLHQPGEYFREKHLKIVTGKGQKGTEGMIRPAVAELLRNEYFWQVRYRTDPSNLGALFVEINDVTLSSMVSTATSHLLDRFFFADKQ